jgi:hypothetical protein
VEPEPVGVCDIRYGCKWIDCARIDRSGSCNDQPRIEPSLAIGNDGLFKAFGLHPASVIDVNPADDALTKAGDPQRLLDTVVCLLGQVDDGSSDIARADAGGIAGSHDRLQRGEACPGGQVTSGRLDACCFALG